MKNNKQNNMLTAVVTLVIAMAFIMPGSAFFTAIKTDTTNTSTITAIKTSQQTLSDYTMIVDPVTAHPGDKNVEITVHGTWGADISSYDLGFYYDPAKIEINRSSIDGTGNGIGHDYGWSFFKTSLAWTDFFGVVAVDMTASAPIPAGSGLLFKFKINISSGVSNGQILLDVGNHDPAFFTIYALAAGGQADPDIVDGIITIIGANNPPNVPSNPSPATGATNVPVNQILSWTGGDPDVDDTVTYDVYFGIVSPPPLVSPAQPGTTYTPPSLAYSTKYYWKIVATDNHGKHTEGLIWDFTTVAAVPDLDATGTLSWDKVKPSSTVTGTITVKNIGDPTSKLSWKVQASPSWGTWTITPSSGIDLKPEDPAVTLSVSVVAPPDKKTTFDGNVTLVNNDDPSDIVVIKATLITPYHPNTLLEIFLNWIIEHFPMLKRIGLLFQ
jgi:hypothetical protein